jgi:predicted dehydrogenase
MKVHQVGIIMNGVTGRMGFNQHLMRSIVAIRQQGGIRIGTEETIVPEPLLIGRNQTKLDALSKQAGGFPTGTDLDKALGDKAYGIYFDAQTTDRRADCVGQAIAHGKHIYCEKPSAHSLEAALRMYRRAKDAGVKHGVVQDKLWLPGMLKLKLLRETGFFGAVSSATGCLKAIRSPSNVPRGITGKKKAAASSWICSATGATYWIIFSDP